MKKLVLEELTQITKVPSSSQLLFFNNQFKDVSYIQQQINNLMINNFELFITQWYNELIRISKKDKNGELFVEYFNLYQKIKYNITSFKHFGISCEDLFSMSKIIVLKYFDNHFGNIELFISSKTPMQDIYQQIITDLDLNNHFNETHYKQIIIKFVKRTFNYIQCRITANCSLNINDYYFLCALEKQNFLPDLNMQENEFKLLKEKLGFMLMKSLSTYEFNYKIHLFYTTLVQDNIITQEVYKIIINDALSQIIEELNYYYDRSKNPSNHVSKRTNPIDKENLKHYFEIFQIIKELEITELKYDKIKHRNTPLLSYILIYTEDTFSQLEIFLKKCLGEIWFHKGLYNPNDILFIIKMLETQQFTQENLGLTQEQINTLLLRDLTILRDVTFKSNNHTSSIKEDIYYNFSLT